MQQLAPNSSTYIIPIAIRLKGNLSLVSLQESMAQIVARHNTLRTVYPEVDGTAVPTILPNLTIEIEQIDLSDLDEQEQHANVSQHIRRQAQKPFDLAQEPLWRSQLLRFRQG